MVRSALGRPNSLDRRPQKSAPIIPLVSVLVASSLALLPIVSEVGWVPDFGFVLLLAWRLLRNDVIAAWWAAPLGLVNDLLTGAPIGSSTVIWTTAMLLLDLLDRRTMWRDYWIEWVLAALLLFMDQVARWHIDTLMGAPLKLSVIFPPLLLSVLVFPLGAWVSSRLDRWRLGR
jgi:rod shape-determining protein MreD